MLMGRVFSGVKPTAEVPHIGNYIGAFRHWAQLQDEHECLFCVVDLHTMTLPWEVESLTRRSRQTAASLIASGIDPGRSLLFVQSEVPEHTELAWILGCLSKMGELGRMTQFKDKSRGHETSVSVGIFLYPVLMAADVLAYRGTHVPVGDDQKQHLELMRDIAERFNRQFGETFPLPEPVIAPHGARIMSLDDPTRKMDKSDDRPNNLIWMNDTPEVVRRKIARAVTDSGKDIAYGPEKPAISNLLDIYSAVTGQSVADLQEKYGGRGYAELKSDLADAVVDFLVPFQERFGEVLSDVAQLDKILDVGAEKAREMALETLGAVREKVGLRRGTR